MSPAVLAHHFSSLTLGPHADMSDASRYAFPTECLDEPEVLLRLSVDLRQTPLHEFDALGDTVQLATAEARDDLRANFLRLR